MLERIKKFSKRPGVYYFKNAQGRVVYVGKAANLRRRVASYFQKAHDERIEQLVSEIHDIDFKETLSVLEALILEANEIRRLMPKYNIKERDDKSFLYLVFTRDKFPKPQLVRGHELERAGTRRFRGVYGPYLSAASIRAALKILRKIFPYSTCEPSPPSSRVPEEIGDVAISTEIASSFRQVGTPRNYKRPKPCFHYHLKLCPGVCIGAVDRRTYAKNIRHLKLFFAGKKAALIKELKREMKQASKGERFEAAVKLRNQIFALEHIQDVAVLTREERPFFGPSSPSPLQSREGRVVNIFGRVEGYDISMISGVEAVGSMVVFEDGEPKKSQYRKFLIKWVKGVNDVAMIHEVLQRRFKRIRNQESGIMSREGWRLPELILIDGGWGQVNVARDVLAAHHMDIPLVGIAKGFKRKQDRPIYDKNNSELVRIVEQYKDLLLRVRDEAHRFAIAYHRKRMRTRQKRLT